MALARGTPNSLIQLLLQSGADPHVSDSGGLSVLYNAARVLNVLAIKWFIAENVDLEVPIGNLGNRKPIFQFLLGHCQKAMGRWHTDPDQCLEYLRAMQAVALAGAKLICVASAPFFTDWTQAQIIRALNWLMPGSGQFSSGQGNPAGNMKEKESSREVRDIVHMLIDMLSKPLSLKHLCRVYIRRTLGRDFRIKLHQLNLPLPLQECLTIYKPVPNVKQEHSRDGGPRREDTEHIDPASSTARGGPSSQWWWWANWPLLATGTRLTKT